MTFFFGGGRGRKGEGSKTKLMDTANPVLYKKYPVHWDTRSAYLQSKKKKEKWGGSSASKYFGIPWSGNVLLFLITKAAPFRRRFLWKYGTRVSGVPSLLFNHCSV